MTEPAVKPSATASVEVAADPATAFRIFTEEIDLWWIRGAINFWDAARAVAMRIEPGVGGRILEVYEPAEAGQGTAEPVEDVLELGRITVWAPGRQLTYRSSVDDTETEVWFEPHGGGTKVTVRQTLLRDGGKAFYFWPNVLHWVTNWTARRESAPRVPREVDRLAIALYYQDPPKAARWLHEVFELQSWDKIPAEGEKPSWIELHVGSASIVLFELTEGSAGAPDHTVWVYVDELDAHFAHSSAAGAKIRSEIHQHGYRRYEAEDLEGHRWVFAQARPTMR